ncbi:MAG TPA: DUF3043 domain-containing protein [Naasia sp.]
MAKQQSPAPAPEQETSVVGKGRSTPTRREREAARKRPLVPDDRKEARKQERARMTQARERARVGLANGEERYLPVRDRGPQRKFVRDYVDARFSIGEILIPTMFLVIFITLIPVEAVQVYGMLGLYALILAAILDAVLVGTIVRRKLAAKVGGIDKVERGLRWYTAMRALQLRPLRLPKPQVKRGQYPS